MISSLSGSSAEPESVTLVCSSTVWSSPASANGLALSEVTVTVTVSVPFAPYGSVAVNSNSKVVESPPNTSGAVNFNSDLFGNRRSTSSPPTCFQVYLSASPSGSEPEPASITSLFERVFLSGPASATGMSLTGLILIITTSVDDPPPSPTAHVNLNAVGTICPFPISGAVNVGSALVVDDSGANGPSVCTHL